MKTPSQDNPAKALSHDKLRFVMAEKEGQRLPEILKDFRAAA